MDCHGLMRLAVVAAALHALNANLAAQTASVTTPPPNIILPNYLGVPSGPYAGLESSATVARVGDPSAAWFNPAGLSRGTSAEVTGSAGLYQFTTVEPQSLPESGGSIVQVPNMFGFTIRAGPSLTAGFALVTTNQWVQETDSQLVLQVSPAQQRFSYSADSELSRRVATFSVGHARGGSWRLGAGLALSLTSLRRIQTATDRIADPVLLRTLIVSSRATGSTTQIRPLLGAQFDASARWQAGLLFRAPGFTVLRNGKATLEASLDNGDEAFGTSFFDHDARFDQRLPAELHGGIAYLGDRLVVELDAQAYTPVDAYPLLSSEEPFISYADGPSSAPVVTPNAFSGFTSASRGFANVALGGHYLLSPSRTMRLHFGAATDLSPVADADQVYAKADLLSLTLGLSGSVGRLTFASGVNIRTGTAENIVIRNLLDGQSINTEIDVRTVGLVYSISYRF
jgi:hypothetical protein